MTEGKQKKRKAKWISTACTLPAVFAVFTGSAAAQAQLQEETEFTLNPLIVTAQRYEKSDLDTPAMTKVYTGEQLQATGAATVVEALKFADGMMYQAQGPAGQSQGAMTSKVFIRGQERGTLILVDGIPLNLRGTFSLEDMAVGDVEKIEIIRGGGSVLYGSNATGGVINIITKKERTNMVQVAAGNFGKQKHALSFQAGKLGVGLNFEKLGDVDAVSAPSTRGSTPRFYDFLGSEKHMFSYTYRFDDHWTFSHSYSENSYANRYNYARKNAVDSYTDYDTTQNRMNLSYADHGWKGSLYLNYRNLYNDKLTYQYKSAASTAVTGWSLAATDTTDRVVGFEMQKDFDYGRDNYLIGISVQDEAYKQSETGNIRKSVSRNIYSAFAQWNHPVTDRTAVAMSARETWTGGAPDDKNYSEFTPQVQVLYKLDSRTSWYASAGKSFTMPTFAQIYGSSINVRGNPDVEPETGTHYESGLKRISGNHSWKLALFKTDIENYITSTLKADETWEVKNEDTKNAGIELSCDIAGENGWSGNWGISYGNPKFKSDADHKGWQRQYGRLQLSGGIHYRQDKLAASLQGSYLGKRVLSSEQSKLRPLFVTGLNISYRPDKGKEVCLNVDNLLDRKDITTHSSSRYYALSRNFELGYRTSF